MPLYNLKLGVSRKELEAYFDRVLENFADFERECLKELEVDKIFESSVDDLLLIFVLTRSFSIKPIPK